MWPTRRNCGFGDSRSAASNYCRDCIGRIHCAITSTSHRCSGTSRRLPHLIRVHGQSMTGNGAFWRSTTACRPDAGTLNRRSCGEDIVLYPGGPLTSKYLPEQLETARGPENELPLALFAPRTNVRITAQQGTFTIHGHSSKSLQQIAAEADPGIPIALACITLDRGNLAFLWDELQLAGVGRLALFPDLESVATHVTWLLQSDR